MPKFLERKLKEEYGQKSAIPFKVMNAIGAMHGNKETAKGREMEAKHMKDHGLRRMEIEVHRDGKGAITGHTVTHTPYEKPKKASKSGAFYEEPKREEYPFSTDDHAGMVAHVTKHLGGGAGKAAAEPEEEEEETEA